MNETYFSEDQVIHVAQKMQTTTHLYEKLFIDLSSQIYVDIVDVKIPSETVNICIQHTDRAMGFLRKNLPDQIKTACRAGCSYCCSFPVTCPPQIISNIALHINTVFSTEELELLKEKLHNYVKEQAHGSFRIQCPFLTEKNTCKIYDHRPLSCRSFTSVNSQNCKHSLFHNSPITQDPVSHRVFQAATTALMAAAAHNDQSTEQQDFIPSLLHELTRLHESQTASK